MTFLNASLLLGLLAAGIPIALHLMARQEPKRVMLPSVRFLRANVTTRQSRLRIRRWWLLAMRVLALLAIAAVLARPMIASTSVAAWSGIATLAAAALGLLVLASLAWTRQMGMPVTAGLAGLAAALLIAASGWSARTWATAETPVTDASGPLAVALLIDNSPSAAWQSKSSTDADSSPTFEPSRDDWSGTRLGDHVRAAQKIIDRLPSGSRVCVLDRSPTPASFSIDESTARGRLMQLDVLANPISIAERIDAAGAVLRTSDLPDRQIIVISDLSHASWKSSEPALSRLSTPTTETLPTETLPTKTPGDDDGQSVDAIPWTVLRSGMPKASLTNRSLSIPKLVDETTPAGVPVPVVVRISVDETTSGSAGTPAGDREPVSVTAELRMFESSPAYPVVRDGKTIRPPARVVDRASVPVSTGGRAEIVLTLPPLDVGVTHAVVQLIGGDAMTWDDTRYLSVSVPEPPGVLIVAGDVNDSFELARALTVPQAIDDPSAAYQISRIGHEDLAAVQLTDFDAVIWIDPPLDRSASQLESLAQFSRSGGGVALLLGPAAGQSWTPPASLTPGIMPTLVRRWRATDPGGFLELTATGHPIFRPLSQLDTNVPWPEFRIQRYWRIDEAGWVPLARFAGTPHSAVVVPEDASRRWVVWTTPLPALAKSTRSWNSLFSGADAWPAFVTVRGMSAWLTGLTRGNLNVLAGQTAVVPSTIDDAAMLFPPGNDLPAPVRSGGPNGSDAANDSAAKQATAPDDRGVMMLSKTAAVGTVFIKGPQTRSGYSVNLDPRWSSVQMIDEGVLRQWTGDDDRTIVDDAETISLGGRGGRGPAVSLHGPLMLLAVMAFLAEQTLGNWFYRPKPEPA